MLLILFKSENKKSTFLLKIKDIHICKYLTMTYLKKNNMCFYFFKKPNF